MMSECDRRVGVAVSVQAVAEAEHRVVDSWAIAACLGDF